MCRYVYSRILEDDPHPGREAVAARLLQRQARIEDRVPTLRSTRSRGQGTSMCNTCVMHCATSARPSSVAVRCLSPRRQGGEQVLHCDSRVRPSDLCSWRCLMRAWDSSGTSAGHGRTPRLRCSTRFVERTVRRRQTCCHLRCTCRKYCSGSTVTLHGSGAQGHCRDYSRMGHGQGMGRPSCSKQRTNRNGCNVHASGAGGVKLSRCARAACSEQLSNSCVHGRAGRAERYRRPARDRRAASRA